jgi:hypothetical protein
MRCLAGKRRLDQLGYFGHIGFAGQAWLEDGHQFAHIGRTFGAGFGNGSNDDGVGFFRAHFFRQVGTEDSDFEFLGIGQFLAAGSFVLGDAVLALFGQLFNDGDDGGVVEFDALIDFLLLEGGEQ